MSGITLLPTNNRNYPIVPIQTNLKVWLSPEAANITLNGSTVSSWNDKSGNGNNVTQGTAGKQPTYVTSTAALNNQPSLSFNGANSNWLGKTGASGIGAAPVTIYIVTANDQASGTAFWLDEDGGSQRSVISYQSGGWDFYSGSHLTVPSLNAGAKMFCYVVNGASSLGYLNSSVAAITGNPGSAGLDSITLGGANGGTGSYQTGNLGEVLIYSGAHSASQVATNFSYFSAKYGIQDTAGIGLVPASLPGLITWFRSDLGVTTSSGKITVWNDQSPTGLILNANGGAASFPTYNTSGGPNNRPYLSFTGTQYIGISSGTAPAPAAMTVFSVQQFNPSSQLSYCVYNNSVSIPTILDSTGTRVLRLQGGDLNVAGQTANYEQWTGTSASGAQVFRVNGTQIATASNANTSPAASTIFGFGGGTTAHPLTGGVTEYILYNRVLNASEIAVVENYLRALYQNY